MFSFYSAKKLVCFILVVVYSFNTSCSMVVHEKNYPLSVIKKQSAQDVLALKTIFSDEKIATALIEEVTASASAKKKEIYLTQKKSHAQSDTKFSTHQVRNKKLPLFVTNIKIWLHHMLV